MDDGRKYVYSIHVIVDITGKNRVSPSANYIYIVIFLVNAKLVKILLLINE